MPRAPDADLPRRAGRRKERRRFQCGERADAGARAAQDGREIRGFSDAFVFGLVIVILLARPQGLVPAKSARERV